MMSVILMVMAVAGVGSLFVRRGAQLNSIKILRKAGCLIPRLFLFYITTSNPEKYKSPYYVPLS